MDSTENVRVPLPVSMYVDEVNTAAYPITTPSPVSPTALCGFDLGSHHALEKAYLDLKRRLKESSSQNHLLVQRIKTLQSAADGTVGKGPGSGDRMEDTIGNGPEEVGLQLAAEEGFTNNLQRQLVRARAQLQAVEAKFQEKVKENDHSLSAMRRQLQDALAQVEQLMEENTTLQQKYEDEKEEKEAALQTMKDLREKCDSLLLEKDKVIKDGAILHDSMRKAHRELAVLKDRQGEMTPAENSQELTEEVAYMRSVIKNLKDMVLEQRERLGNCSKARPVSFNPRTLQSTMGRSFHDLSNGVTDTSPAGMGQTGGSSYSGQSWEMVNISHPPSLSTRQQQEQQQQQQLMAMQQRCVTSSSSAFNPYWAPHNMTASSALMKPPMVKGEAGRDKASVISNGGLSKGWGSQSAVVQRQPNHNLHLPTKSRTEVLRSTSANPSKPPDFLDGGCHQPPLLGKGRVSPSPASRPTLPHETAAGQNHLGQIPESVPGVTTHPTPLSVGGSANPAMYLQHLAGSVLKDSSKMDVDSTTAPSMHILNQGGMAGARVIRNSWDSFGSGGVTTVLGSPLLTGLSTPDLVHRLLPSHVPQEHDDRTQWNNAAMFELSPLGDTNIANAPPVNPAGSGLDRKCPVCGQDFSHISMDEFQSHVFECFDNAEENSMAPETLQPQAAPAAGAEVKERICPVCEKRFAEKNFSQQHFEGHVQSHFEEAAEQFEVLEVKES